MSNTIQQGYSPAQLTRIRQIFNGEDIFKSTSEAEPDGLKDVIIVGGEGDLMKGVDPGDLTRELSAKGVQVEESLDRFGVTARVSQDKLADLKEDGYLVYDNSPRPLVPGIPRSGSVRSLVGDPDYSMPKVEPTPWLKADQLHQQGITGKGQVVAVLDSGYDHPQHPPLAWKDVVNGNQKPVDMVGHGTHVAGDVLQTAPDAQIVAVKVMGDDGTGRPSDIIRGLQWVINEKKAGRLDVDVINMSLGGPPDGFPDKLDPVNRTVEAAVRAGITVVAAAGNSGPEGHTIGSPADSGASIAVGATLNPTTVSQFSSRGPTDDGLIKPDVMAPGEFISSWSVPGSEMEQTGQVVERLRAMSGEELKAVLRDKPHLIDALGLPPDILKRPSQEVEDLVKPNLPGVYLPGPGLIAAPGTSFASPLVAGVVAALEQEKDLSPVETREVLRGSADSMGQFSGNEQGAGFVNAEKALNRIRQA
ncbi:MAG: S8 family serine peptidase [Candidatus Eremiobacterota bacterium]